MTMPVPDRTADFGSPNHAAAMTEGRHPAVRDALQWLAFSHLPEQLRRFSYPFYSAAVGIVDQVRADSPELTTALNALISAKDHAMRAGIKADTGRAGSVPRPQTVVDPPVFTDTSLGRPFVSGQAAVPMTRPTTEGQPWNAFVSPAKPDDERD